MRECRRALGRMMRRCLVIAIASCVGGGLALPARAQAPADDAAARARLDALFQQTLTNPADLDATFRFAEASTAAGDYEAAIGALERILFFNSQLARVHLELGILYFRLGSYAIAREHLAKAISGPDVPPEVHQRVGEFLAEADRRLSRHQFDAMIRLGMRYQTNANVGPSSTTGRFFGVDFDLPSDSRRQADWNGFGQVMLRHVYDLQRQSGESIETNVQAYYAAQIRLPRYNLGLIEVDTGPRLLLHPTMWPRTVIRPYAIGGFAGLGDVPYLSTWGGGVTLDAPTYFGMHGEFRFEHRRREFYNTSVNPDVAGQSGGLTLISGTLRRRLDGVLPGLSAMVRGTLGENYARQTYYEFTLYQIDAGLTWEVDPPFVRLPAKATIAATLTRIWTDYRTPNPLYDSTIVRRDREWRFVLGVDVPITNRVGGFAQLVYANVDSNLPNFAYTNLAVSFGPSIRF